VSVLDRVLCFEKSVLLFSSLGCSRTDLKEWNSKKKLLKTLVFWFSSVNVLFLIYRCKEVDRKAVQ
jgi:hypothetical protein